MNYKLSNNEVTVLPDQVKNVPEADAGLGTLLFTFAIITDTHINPRDDETNSPWPSFAKANDRARQAIRSINSAEPAFVVHLGDEVNPTPGLPGYDGAVGRFRQIFADLRPALHTIPGNHDVGDKPLAWMPAKMVQHEYLASYVRHFGPHFRAFSHDNCRFILLNAPLLNSGLPEEEQQARWLEREFAAHKGERIFVFCHYPPFILYPDEDGHYDNIDEPARSWLLELARRYNVEAVFSGHVHNFFFNRVASTDLYVVPSTAFVRADYNEMFRVGPLGDCGRDDGAKLGWMLIEVRERGHVAHVIRLEGPGARGSLGDMTFANPKNTLAAHCKLGVDMRQPWAERVEIPYNGVVDEFARKLARNDYPVLSLWEMGIGRMRVPFQDFANKETRSRMEALAAAGFSFCVFSYGLPEEGLWAGMSAARNLLDAVEIILPSDKIASSLNALAEFRTRTAVPVFLSKLWRATDVAPSFKLLINHGFTWSLPKDVSTLLERDQACDALDGLVFRIGRDDPLAEAVASARRICDEHSILPVAHVRLADDNPGKARLDEEDTKARVLEGAAASKLHNMPVYFDTLCDVDRGSFPRIGFVDRLYNPRSPGIALRQFLSADASR